MSNCKNEYKGFFAEFYDILQGEANEVSAYCDFIDQYKDPVLEIGCGTGRLLIPLAKKGYDITGIDLSEDMLDICRDKLNKQKLNDRVKLVKADMRNFKLDQKFNFIFTACNTIFHLLSLDDLKSFLNSVKYHLTDGGVFVIDISAPNIKGMIDSDGEEFTSEYIYPEKGTKIVNYFSPEYDILNQMETDTIVLKEYDEGKLIREASTEVNLTFFWPRELKIVLESCGFKIIEKYGSIQGDPLNSDSNEIIILSTLA